MTKLTLTVCIPLGEKLEEIRIKQKLSKENFAEYLGVPASTYSRISNNKGTIRQETLAKIEDKLGIKLVNVEITLVN